MTEKKKTTGLGRGLSALLGDVAMPQPVLASAGTADAGGTPVAGVRMLPIGQISANPQQPRRHFDEEAIAELAESIRNNGLLQPILVRPFGAADDRFQLVAGERRWRAAQRAQLHDVPVIVRPLSDEQALEIGLIENIQRRDLNPVEEAEGYQRLIRDFGHSAESVAQLIARSRSHVANMLRLLELPDSVRAMLVNGSLSMGHARALLTTPDPARLAELVRAKGLSVRQTEALAKQNRGERAAAPRRATRAKDADTAALERDLSAALGLAVRIDDAGGIGKISIEYNNLEDLDSLWSRLSRPPEGF